MIINKPKLFETAVHQWF